LIELSDFLRTRRARLSPSDVGLTISGRRRTPGLRREEVAVLAGVGTSWYTWLEQGRNIKVSEAVARAIGRALRLNESELAYFYRLVEINPVSALSGPDKSERDSDFAQIVRAWLPNPALVLNECWDLLACNAVARDVFGLAESDTNLLVAFFTNEECRRRYVESELMAKLSVAQFRANMVRHFDNPRFTELADRLSGRSDEFRRLWHSHEVLEMSSKRKAVRHPTLGRLDFQTYVWQLRGAEGVSMVLYLPDDTTSSSIRNSLVGPAAVAHGPAA
jgi:transcriptional regulator with XRE-family HTH domain